MKIAVFPGSFDPITNGHEDIIRRASALFDHVVVGVLHNESKTPLFTNEEKVEMLEDVLGDLKNVKIKVFGGLLVDFVHQEGASVIVRGMRGVTDFEYEMLWSQANKAVSDDIETVFLITDPKYSFISSSVVREYAKNKADISGFVNPKIIDRITGKYTIPGGN